MASPGRITVSGVGHIIQQFRELLKDLKFRNRQEEQLGELEIARKHLELRQSAVSPPALDYVAGQVLHEYKRLATNGKLLPPYSIPALVDALVRRVAELRGEVPELKAISRQISSLRNPNLPNWKSRCDSIRKAIHELYQHDKLNFTPYEDLMNRLRQLERVREGAA
jgi:hypothetical protein